MDCQTETYSEVEELKGKKHQGCTYCDEILQLQAGKKLEESRISASTKNAEGFSNAANGSFSNSVTPMAEDVLEISGPLYISDDPGRLQIDDVLLLPEDEPKISLPEEEAVAVGRLGGAQERASNPEPEMVPHVLSHPNSNFISEADEAVPLKETHFLEESQASEAGQSGKVRMIAPSAPGLRLIAAAFVLLIVIGGVFITPSGSPSVKTEEPAKTVLPARPESRQDAAGPTAPSTHETSEPVLQSSPAVVDNQPAPVTSSANQSAGQDQAIFTIQIGSHKEMGEASDQAAKVKSAGFEPRVVSVEIPNRGTWYRVQVGEFSSREEASRLGARMRAEGMAENFIIASL